MRLSSTERLATTLATPRLQIVRAEQAAQKPLHRRLAASGLTSYGRAEPLAVIQDTLRAELETGPLSGHAAPPPMTLVTGCAINHEVPKSEYVTKWLRIPNSSVTGH